MTRKLASIQKIRDIKSIPDADSICAYQINDWWVVDSIGKYEKDTFVIYCEPDSWIPTALAPFLSKGQEPREYEGIKGERLRTVRLRKQISQGLILPFTATFGIKLGAGAGARFSDYEGRDVSAELGIVKYEPPVPACLAGVVKGSFPSSIPKTDEERIQNLTGDWATLSEYEWEMSEKIDGSSTTIGLVDDDFIVCSRNLNLTESEGNTFWKLARKYDIENKMRALNLNNFAIQAETIGEGIQKNLYALKGQDLFVFAIYDITKGGYVAPNVRNEITQSLGLKHVPIISSNISLRGKTIADVIELANAQSALNSNQIREGVVFKRVDGQEHFKAISNKFLLKFE